jgi:2-dehydropantoate 2-reductase
VRILVVGAGATGGYLGVHLTRAGRDVTFLARPRALARLSADGVRIRGRGGLSTTPVNAITAANLDGPYDVVLVAVRSDAVESAVDDFRAAVGGFTRIVPLMNGMAHLSTLTAAFGENAVLGATAKLATSLLPDGTIEEVVPGVQLEIGSLDGSPSGDISSVAREFAVDGISVSTTNTVRMAMWEKFAFITATAVLTCLVGDVIGPIARASGGTTLAGRILDEVDSVAIAEGYPLSGPAKEALHQLLTDPQSGFGPSMFRDLRAGRTVETSVFSDLTARARHHDLSIPLVDAATVVIDLRARQPR